uniref:Uncharacterized protein n=2 Tax=Strongyloides stercoralis TaxID=6248 RepID=A0AAF5DIB8_STRER
MSAINFVCPIWDVENTVKERYILKDLRMHINVVHKIFDLKGKCAECEMDSTKKRRLYKISNTYKYMSEHFRLCHPTGTPFLLSKHFDVDENVSDSENINVNTNDMMNEEESILENSEDITDEVDDEISDDTDHETCNIEFDFSTLWEQCLLAMKASSHITENNILFFSSIISSVCKTLMNELSRIFPTEKEKLSLIFSKLKEFDKIGKSRYNIEKNSKSKTEKIPIININLGTRLYGEYTVLTKLYCFDPVKLVETQFSNEKFYKYIIPPSQYYLKDNNNFNSVLDGTISKSIYSNLNNNFLFFHFHIDDVQMTPLGSSKGSTNTLTVCTLSIMNVDKVFTQNIKSKLTFNNSSFKNLESKGVILNGIHYRCYICCGTNDNKAMHLFNGFYSSFNSRLLVIYVKAPKTTGNK